MRNILYVAVCLDLIAANMAGTFHGGTDYCR